MLAPKLMRHLPMQVIVFAVPGAFTGVCHNAHVPSYSKNVAAFKAKGVDSVICVSVNDPYTMNAWKKTLGASGEGIEFYGDSNGSFTHYMVSSISLFTILSLPSLLLSLPLVPFLISPCLRLLR
jgi:peroxiredoxin